MIPTKTQIELELWNNPPTKAEKLWYRKNNKAIAGIFLALLCFALILKGDAQKIAAIAYSALLLALFGFGATVYYLKRARFKRVAKAFGITIYQLVELIKLYG